MNSEIRTTDQPVAVTHTHVSHPLSPSPSFSCSGATAAVITILETLRREEEEE